MARVTQHKAAKDYPKEGIKKGDMYYMCQIKLQRGGLTIRSLTPIPRWRTTMSNFKSTLWRIEDESFNGIDSADALRDVAEEIRELGAEAQESFDNMPEGLQQGDTGQMLEERASACESWAYDIETAASELEEKLEALTKAEELASTYAVEVDQRQEDDHEIGEPDEWDSEWGAIDEFDIDAARKEAIEAAVEAAEGANPGMD